MVYCVSYILPYYSVSDTWLHDCSLIWVVWNSSHQWLKYCLMHLFSFLLLCHHLTRQWAVCSTKGLVHIDGHPAYDDSQHDCNFYLHDSWCLDNDWKSNDDTADCIRLYAASLWMIAEDLAMVWDEITESRCRKTLLTGEIGSTSKEADRGLPCTCPVSPLRSRLLQCTGVDVCRFHAAVFNQRNSYSSCQCDDDVDVRLSADVFVDLLLLITGVERLLMDLWVTKRKACRKDEKFNGSEGPTLELPHRPPLKVLIQCLISQGFLSVECGIFLQCLVGPPVGLNLRNLLWHGFLDSSLLQTYCSERHVSALVLAAFSSIQQEFNSTCGRGVVHSSLNTWAITEVQPVFGTSHVWKASASQLLDAVRLSRFFSQPNTRTFVSNQLSSWIFGREDDSCQNHRFIASVLPSLEHGLRQAFVASNQLPEELNVASTFEEI